MIIFLHEPSADPESVTIRQALFEIGCRMGIAFTVVADRANAGGGIVVRYGRDEAAAGEIALPCARGGESMLHIAEKPLWGVATPTGRSEEHTSELQSLMRISYAVFCLKKKKNK